ncbi:hypothetical protein FRAHR75_2400003 [Frankia sp. Hr75.2]|nr:hypothetical protein FRAHR75_2400003 [Frankia sp. Hr75.2]
MRREALCCIPSAAGMDSEEDPWVRWLTSARKGFGGQQHARRRRASRRRRRRAAVGPA